MARGTWDDFADKWGFSDGAGIEGRDFQARSIIISKLNKLPEFKQSHIRAVAYDRPGVHNACLIILLSNPENKTDDQLLAEWQANKLESVQLPSGDYDIENIVFEAYEELSIISHLTRSKPKIQLLSVKRKSR
jgi:hypothetical protein